MSLFFMLFLIVLGISIFGNGGGGWEAYGYGGYWGPTWATGWGPWHGSVLYGPRPVLVNPNAPSIPLMPVTVARDGADAPEKDGAERPKPA